jgi:hypothetical protein
MLKGVVKQITLQFVNQASTNQFLFYGPRFLLKTLRINSSKFQGVLLFFNLSSCVRLMHNVHLNI